MPWVRWLRYCHGTSARTHSTGLRSSPTRQVSAWLVGDLIYIPPETPLLAAARMRGNVTVNGLGLLLNQARPAFNAWFGVMPEITPALRQAIAATF
jgi:shikimate 5-dehydrogenase